MQKAEKKNLYLTGVFKPNCHLVHKIRFGSQNYITIKFYTNFMYCHIFILHIPFNSSIKCERFGED